MTSVIDITDYIDITQRSLWISVASIIFNPLFWNIVARQEYKNKVVTKLFRGRSLYGCAALAITIFVIGLVRDQLFASALEEQPIHPMLSSSLAKAVGAALFTSGTVLVLSSMWMLGFTGTYLGDYFGILMDAPVTSFPFNITGSPMYDGSTLNFLGTALWYGRPVGLLLTLEVYLVYQIALQYEDPFTSQIYAKRDRERSRKAKSG